MQFIQMKQKLSIHGALCSSLGGMWKGLDDNVLNRAKSSCSIVPVGWIVGNVGLNKVALSSCHLAVPSLQCSAQWGWLSGWERGCYVVASSLCMSVTFLESMWKCVWEDTSEKTQPTMPKLCVRQRVCCDPAVRQGQGAVGTGPTEGCLLDLYQTQLPGKSGV